MGDLSQKPAGQGFLLSYSAEERTGAEARCQMRKENWKNVLIRDWSCSRITRRGTGDAGRAPGPARQARFQTRLLAAGCARAGGTSPGGGGARPRHGQDGSQATAPHTRGAEGHLPCHPSASAPAHGDGSRRFLPACGSVRAQAARRHSPRQGRAGGTALPLPCPSHTRQLVNASVTS